jgi:hypothetical protein
MDGWEVLPINTHEGGGRDIMSMERVSHVHMFPLHREQSPSAWN